MKVRLIGSPVGDDSADRGTVERRVRLVVGRRAAGVSQVEVVLSRSTPSMSGARDASAQRLRCRIRTRLADGELIVVEESGPTTEAALDAALWRLDHRLARPRARRSA
jgi:hypothetical protein